MDTQMVPHHDNICRGKLQPVIEWSAPSITAANSAFNLRRDLINIDRFPSVQAC